MPEPKWRITIEGEGTLSQAQWAALNSIVDNTKGLHYETFPLFDVEDAIGALGAPHPDRFRRGETPRHTLHCRLHGYYTWRGDDGNRACPRCAEVPYEERPLHERERLDGVSGV